MKHTQFIGQKNNLEKKVIFFAFVSFRGLKKNSPQIFVLIKTLFYGEFFLIYLL